MPTASGSLLPLSISLSKLSMSLSSSTVSTGEMELLFPRIPAVGLCPQEGVRPVLSCPGSSYLAKSAAFSPLEVAGHQRHVRYGKDLVILFVLPTVGGHQGLAEKLKHSGLAYQSEFSTIFPFNSPESPKQHLGIPNSENTSSIPHTLWYFVSTDLSWVSRTNHRIPLCVSIALCFAVVLCVQGPGQAKALPEATGPVCQDCAGHNHLAYTPVRPVLGAHWPGDTWESQSELPEGGQ